MHLDQSVEIHNNTSDFKGLKTVIQKVRLNSLLYITEKRHLLSQLCPTDVLHLELLSLMGFSLTAQRTPLNISLSLRHSQKKRRFVTSLVDICPLTAAHHKISVC